MERAAAVTSILGLYSGARAIGRHYHERGKCHRGVCNNVATSGPNVWNNQRYCNDCRNMINEANNQCVVPRLGEQADPSPAVLEPGGFYQGWQEFQARTVAEPVRAPVPDPGAKALLALLAAIPSYPGGPRMPKLFSNPRPEKVPDPVKQSAAEAKRARRAARNKTL